MLKGLPLSDGSVEVIYSSHTFEHFTYPQSVAVAKECFRILKPQGILRVAVPDLEKMVQDYLADPAPLASHRLVDRLLLHKTWRDILHPGAHHSQMFDRRSLLTMFAEAGFPGAEVRRFGESAIPDRNGLRGNQSQFPRIRLLANTLPFARDPGTTRGRTGNNAKN